MNLQLNATSNLASTYLFPKADGPPCGYFSHLPDVLLPRVVGELVLLQLALFVEYLAADIARVLVANVHFVDGGHVSLLVLGDLSAKVAHPRLQRLRLFWRSWNEMCIYLSTICFCLGPLLMDPYGSYPTSDFNFKSYLEGAECRRRAVPCAFACGEPTSCGSGVP